MYMPAEYRYFVLLIITVNCVLTVVWEKVPVKICGKRWDKRYFAKKQKQLLERIEEANTMGIASDDDHSKPFVNNHRSSNKIR